LRGVLVEEFQELSLQAGWALAACLDLEDAVADLADDLVDGVDVAGRGGGALGP
jgi:hypothetical protein